MNSVFGIWDGLEDIIVPVAGICFACIVCIAPLIALYLIMRLRAEARRKKEEALMHLCEKAIDSGTQLPDNFLEALKPVNPVHDPEKVRNRWRNVGILLVAFAVALGCLCPSVVLQAIAIPGSMGLASLLIYWLSRKENKKEDNA